MGSEKRAYRTVGIVRIVQEQLLGFVWLGAPQSAAPAVRFGLLVVRFGLLVAVNHNQRSFSAARFGLLAVQS